MLCYARWGLHCTVDLHARWTAKAADRCQKQLRSNAWNPKKDANVKLPPPRPPRTHKMYLTCYTVRGTVALVKAYMSGMESK